VSGPKVDHAELERQRRAELERQRQERLHSIRKETERLNRELLKAKMQVGQIDRHLTQLVAYTQNNDVMASVVTALNALRKKHKDMLTMAINIDIPTEPNDISACCNRLIHETSRLLSLYNNDIVPYEERVTDYRKQMALLDDVASVSEQFSARAEKIKDLSRIVDLDFSIKLENNSRLKTEQSNEHRAIQIFEEIEELINSESIQDHEIESLLSIAGDIHRAAFMTKSTFDAATVEYSIVRANVLRNISIFDDTYQEYFAQYIEYANTLNISRSKSAYTKPVEKYRFGSLEDLESEISFISEAAMKANERNYMAAQINEVMEQFGFNVSEELIIDSTQVGSHTMCKNISDRTAIHMHISEDKRVMMEVVGLGAGKSRASEPSINAAVTLSSELSNSERDRLVGEQVRFCDMHPMIVAALRERGVILNKHSRREPDIKYSKVIGSAEFDIGAVIESASRLTKRIESESLKRRRTTMKEKLMVVKV